MVTGVSQPSPLVTRQSSDVTRGSSICNARHWRAAAWSKQQPAASRQDTPLHTHTSFLLHSRVASNIRRTRPGSFTARAATRTTAALVPYTLVSPLVDDELRHLTTTHTHYRTLQTSAPAAALDDLTSSGLYILKPVCPPPSFRNWMRSSPQCPPPSFRNWMRSSPQCPPPSFRNWMRSSRSGSGASFLPTQ